MAESITEKETIIRFKEEANTARIETVNAGLLRELDKAVKTNEDIICEERTEESGVFVLPKRLLIYVHRLWTGVWTLWVIYSTFPRATSRGS